MNAPLQQEDYCGTFFAAKLLGFSVGTIQTMVEKGELQAWKTQGGHRRISMQSIREYQRKHGLAEVPEKTPRVRIVVASIDQPRGRR